MHLTPEVQQRLAAFLDGRLTVTLIALRLDTAGLPEVQEDVYESTGEDDTSLDAYAPGQFLACRRDVNGGDIGLGRPRLLQVVVSGDGAEPWVQFGRSQGSVADALVTAWCQRHPDWESYDLSFIPTLSNDEILELLDEDGETFPYLGPTGLCVSLWGSSQSDLSVLMLEELASQSDEHPRIPPHRSRDLLATATRYARGDSGGHLTLRSLGIEQPDPACDRPLAELFVLASDTVRGEALVRAMSVLVQSGAQELVEEFIHPGGNFDAIYDLQHSGHIATSRPVDLVSEPATDGAECCCTTDGRFVVLNLDAMSVHHDYYFGHDTGWTLPALVPVLCSAGESDEAFALLREGIVRPPGEDASYEEQVNLIRSIYRQQAKERIARTSIHREEARNWSNSGQLASLVDEVFDVQRKRVTETLGSCVDIAETTRQLHRELLSQSRERLLEVLAVLGSVVAALALFAGFAAVPEGRWHFLSTWAPMSLLLIVPVVTALLKARRRPVRE